MGSPPKGAIVASTINFNDVSINDLGIVDSVINPFNEGRLTVKFTDGGLNMLPSHMREIMHLRVNHFVCSTIDWPPGRLKVGDVGLVTGISKGATNKDRVVVEFGHNNVLDLAPEQTRKAPPVFGHVGSKVYSTIDWQKLKKGDCGTIQGVSSDREVKDRVCVKFDNCPLGINLDGSMISLEPPVVHQSTLGLDSMRSIQEALDQMAPSDKQRLKEALDQMTASMNGSLQIANTALQASTNYEGESLNDLRTEDVTLISHAHGRARRAERNIMRKELQAAIKYGTKERANPGRDGGLRWRFAYDGIVYITDETCRHEVTSWRIDGKDEDTVAPAEIELGGKGCHAVLIVDNSGSMRNPDVPGYKTRSAAVYDCLIRDFIKEQVRVGAAKDVVVTLISMSNEATVLMKTNPLDHTLIAHIEKIKSRRPKSHGNYIPALDKALEVMTEDAPNRGSLLLMMFSDGAPSDQQGMECEHGIPVFQIDRNEDPTMQHRSSASAWSCRRSLHEKVKVECLQRIKRIGQVFGRDRVISRMIAFGPPKEDFSLLSEMASALPRGEFQKLGLNGSNLKTAFSSLSSSMTELRTGGGCSTLTPRLDKVVDKNQNIDTSKKEINGWEGWYIYSHDEFLGKYQLDGEAKLKKVALSNGATGLSFVNPPFEEGAERLVFRCTEIEIPEDDIESWYNSAEDCTDMRALRARSGLRLVAKEAKVVENVAKGRRFHETFARIQQDAAELANQFSQRLPYPSPSSWKVSFVPTSIYCCKDEDYKNDKCWVLCEPELDGRFTKWNNNAGAIKASTEKLQSADISQSVGFQPMGFGMALIEESDEEDEDGEAIGPIQIDDIPQAFSHFTYEHSNGKNLVCDLQGVWNQDDGFVLTDPVVHYVTQSGKKHKNGATDKGLQGVERFFETHRCNSLCKRMQLQERSPFNLIPV